MRRLRAGEWIAGAGGVALPAALLLDWYGAASAWEAFGFLDVALALLAVLPLALVAAQATRPSPSVPVALSVLTTLGGALAVLLILVRIVDQPGPNDAVEIQAGAWLGLLAAAVVAAGGWRSMRAESVPGAPMQPIEDQPLPAP